MYILYYEYQNEDRFYMVILGVYCILINLNVICLLKYQYKVILLKLESTNK